MRIISSYSDYYDTAQGFGVDLTKIFNRVSGIGQPFPLPQWNDHVYWGDESTSTYPKFEKSSYKYSVSDPELQLNCVYILVAGKLYGGIRVKDRRDRKPGLPYPDIYTIWTEKGLEDLQAATNIWTVSRNGYRKFDTKRENKSYETACKILKVKDDEIIAKWAIDNNITIAAFGSHMVERGKDIGIVYHSEINPSLKTYNFQEVIDPFTLYQEIEMYLGGVLGNKEVIPEMADKDKVVSHGFDPKWSFRKHKDDNK